MVRIHSMDWPVNLNFEWYETPTGTSSYPVPETEVRISFYDGVDHTSLGSWAYVGKDALKIPAGETTMHFGSLGVYGPDEDKRIIRHEWGHMLGRKHEHYHPDKPWDLTEALYVAAEGWGWSREKTYRVYGLRLEREDHKVGPYDPLSNMHYNMLAEWNTAGLFIGANGDLSEGDLTWADSCYPFEDDGQDDGTAVYLPTVPMG